MKNWAFPLPPPGAQIQAAFSLFPVTISPSIISNRHFLSHETSLFFPFFCSETSENSSSYLFFNTLHLCSIWMPKPTSIAVDEHKGSSRGSPNCSTEQKNHLFRSEIGIKSLAINLGSLRGAQKFYSKITPETCASLF